MKHTSFSISRKETIRKSFGDTTLYRFLGADFAIAARTRPGQSAYASLLGLIPGDESDEEFIHALEELSPDAVKALDAALAKIA